jgi:cytochrome c peroxidase
VVSGPRALAFSPDGKLALMANSGSEDVLVFDGASGNERMLVRPLPAAFLEGIAVDHAGARAYVDGRNTHNVVVLALAPNDPIAPVAVDGDPIERLAAADPMPPDLRLGQRLFYTANSAAFPLTRNFWVSCSTCHLEGQTDAVTWLFLVGPRDTPSNAGGPINTGFLLRQALRKSIVEYDTTINLEQGGFFHRTDPTQKPLFDALAAFVNQAIPFPQNPNRATDATLSAQQLHGKDLFLQNCRSCHAGEYLTDSGSGNPTLDLDGPIVLHDIGTCAVGGAFPDQPAPDEVVGKMHSACDFDTPTLRGILTTPPYFHDGSAATLRDAVDRLPAAATLSPDDRSALVEYLKTL